MTLSDRNLEIDRVVAHVTASWPFVSNDTLLELASSYLAVNKGLVVSPAEIERVLADAAGFVP